MSDAPAPGSDEALDLGCRCPVLDNAHGAGFPAGPETLYWMRDDCPVHSAERCPACGQELPEVDGQSPCLCPSCGCRCCEGGV